MPHTSTRFICGNVFFPRRAPWRRVAGVGLLFLGLLPIGCDRETAPERPAAGGAVQLDAPLSATRNLLELLRTHLRALAEGDRVAAAAARDRVVWHVAARDDIRARYERISGLRADDEAKRLRLWRSHVESWAAIIAAYADGLEWDGAVVSTDPGGRSAVVRVPAHGTDDEATLRVHCLRDTAGRWHVQRIDFDHTPPRGARSGPTTHAAEPGDS